VITFTSTSVAPCSSTGYEVHRYGDPLFPGGLGKTTTPENFNSLLDDVQSRLFDVLPDDTWFYPGHGDDSTLGEQKPHLDEWRARGW
jgi:glyoxylase-like metal-dependent hydrolase (beta-lactamase superfamily II)